jgi:HD-like signal output (HDOD) protein
MPLSKLDNKSYYIPSKPEILISLQKIMSHEEPDLLEISNLVASDLGLAAVVLQTINSPVFGMNRVNSDIKQAVMFIGIDAIYAIVQGHALKNSFRSKSCISLERFWDEIVLVANAMCFIGQKVKEKIPIETLYAIGLFHDCGIAALATNYDDYKEVLINSNGNGNGNGNGANQFKW